MTDARGPDDALFRELTEPLLAEGLAEEGTIMGFPCLRAPGGAFLATAEHRTGDLVVKLPRERVAELIASGAGEPFAPAGRPFREWARIPGRDAGLWRALLDEARAFATGSGRARGRRAGAGTIAARGRE